MFANLGRSKSGQDIVKCSGSGCPVIFKPMYVRLQLGFNICKPCQQKDPHNSFLRFEDPPLTYKHYTCDPPGSQKFKDKVCDVCAKFIIGDDLFCFDYALCEDCFYTDAIKPQLFRWIHSFVDTVGPPKSNCHGCLDPTAGRDCSYPDFFVCSSCPNRPNLLISIRNTLPSVKTPGIDPFIKLYRADASKRMKESMATCHVCLKPQPEREPMWAINYMLCKHCEETPNDVILTQFRGMFSRHIQRLVPWPDRSSMYKKTGVELGQGKSGSVIKVMSASAKKVEFAQKLVYTPSFVKKEALDAAKKKADLLVDISHANIVKGIDVFETPPHRISIVMEQATSDLEHWLKGKTITNEVAWKLALDIADGLFHLHNHRKVVHNDVTASNILVFERQGNQNEGIVRTFKLGALEIAPVEPSPADAAASNNIMVATDQFLAPEVLQDRTEEKHRTFASDMWGFGCVLYFATQGKHPFFSEKDTHHQAWFKISQGRLTFRPETDDELADVIRGLLKNRPGQRMTAEDVLNFKKKTPKTPYFFCF